MKEQIGKLANMGMRAYSEGFKKTVRQATLFQPSLDPSKFVLEKNVVNNDLVDKFNAFSFFFFVGL